MICTKCRKSEDRPEGHTLCHECHTVLKLKRQARSSVFPDYMRKGGSYPDDIARRNFYRRSAGTEPSLPKFKFMERDE